MTVEVFDFGNKETRGITLPCDEVIPHRPAPLSWRWDSETGDYVRWLICRYCGLPVQRRGLLRRWRHVT